MPYVNSCNVEFYFEHTVRGTSVNIGDVSVGLKLQRQYFIIRHLSHIPVGLITSFLMCQAILILFYSSIKQTFISFCVYFVC